MIILTSFIVSCVSFLLAYLIFAKLFFTSVSFPKEAFIFMLVNPIISGAIRYFLPEGIAGILSVIVFFILAWKILRLKFKDACIFSGIWLICYLIVTVTLGPVILGALN